MMDHTLNPGRITSSSFARRWPGLLWTGPPGDSSGLGQGVTWDRVWTFPGHKYGCTQFTPQNGLVGSCDFSMTP